MSAWIGGEILKIGLDLAVVLDRQLLALAIERLAHRQAHPALADAIFLDIGLLGALEADADAALQQGGVVVGAVRVVRQAVGRGIGHCTYLALNPHGFNCNKRPVPRLLQ